MNKILNATLAVAIVLGVVLIIGAPSQAEPEWEPRVVGTVMTCDSKPRPAPCLPEGIES